MKLVDALVGLRVDAKDEAIGLDIALHHARASTVLAVPLSTSIHKLAPSHLPLSAGETGLGEDSVAWSDNIGTISKDQLIEPIAGHRPLTNTQIARLADLVRLAMGCVD